MSGEINVGDTVRILGSDAVGTVSKILNDRNNRLVVSLGKFEFTIHKTKVSVINPSGVRDSCLRNKLGKPKIYLNVERPKAQNFPNEIDLHGFLVHDALAWLEVWIDKALLTNQQSLKIIHGKGTGALRIAIRQYLKNHKHVKISKVSSILKDDGVTCVEI